MTKNRKQIAIVFLTFNSDKTIRNSLKKASKITRNIYVVDSFSSDKTIEICKSFHCKIIKRKFKNYSDQRNWIIQKLNKEFLWQLHLDADEVLDGKSIKKIKSIVKKNDLRKKAFLIKRKYYFLGKKLNFPGLNEWHLRLFQFGTTICENTFYDQHFITYLKVNKIEGYIHDNDKLNLNDWKIKHKKWAILEAKSNIKKKNHINNFKNKNDPRDFIAPLKLFIINYQFL